MFPIFLRRPLAALLLTLLSSVLLADDDAGIALTLDDAQQLAISQQPLLAAQRYAADAARAAAIAAGQLPDPMLTGGITDLTLTGADRYTLHRESDTQIVVGVQQQFPRAQKRRLQAERGEHRAELAEQQLTAQALLIRRDTAQSWLQVWKAEQAQLLAKAALREAERQLQASDIATSAGRATQSDALAARVNLGLLQDESAKLDQDAAHARALLSRWIGADAAQRLLCPDLPDWPAPAALADLQQHLLTHPHLNVEAQRVALVGDDVAIAREAYHPDWGLSLGYGHRPAFADYLNLQFNIDLPVFTRNRQDRNVAARLAEQDAAEQMREDELRQQQAELRLNWQDWQLLQARLARFDTNILVASEQRVQSSLIAWQNGQLQLTGVLTARRDALAVRMKRLELTADAAKHRINLQYFSGE